MQFRGELVGLNHTIYSEVTDLDRPFFTKYTSQWGPNDFAILLAQVISIDNPMVAGSTNFIINEIDSPYADVLFQLNDEVNIGRLAILGYVGLTIKPSSSGLLIGMAQSGSGKSICYSSTGFKQQKKGRQTLQMKQSQYRDKSIGITCLQPGQKAVITMGNTVSAVNQGMYNALYEAENTFQLEQIKRLVQADQEKLNRNRGGVFTAVIKA